MDSFSADEFVQGFLEEASEHLQAIHLNLLRLEQSLPLPASAARSIEQSERAGELFRSFHTIKGLAGMVGLQPAALLSHSLEAVLQTVQKSPAYITPALLDLLISATHTLEAVIHTLRDPSAPLPDILPAQQALAALLPVGSPQPAGPAPAFASAPAAVQGAHLLPVLESYPGVRQALNDADLTKIRTANNEGLLLYLAFFVPSSEKSARGENVDLVRQQIAQLGEIIKAVPLLEPGGIRFAFLIAAATPIGREQIFTDEMIQLDLSAASQAQADEPAAAPPESAPISRALLVSNIVRVELSRLDEIMQHVADLIQIRNRLGGQLGQLNGSAPVRQRHELQQTYTALGRSLRDLRVSVTRARLVPLSEAFTNIHLAVRDALRSTGKEARLKIEGEETQVDKLLVDRLLDPLIHLARNAIIHGIETPEERKAAGKPPLGRLTVQAAPEGNHIRITVEDDGRGIDVEAIEARAAAQGLLAPGERVTAENLLDILSRPGFTTKEQADLTAGRGIGLEIVQKALHAIGGSLTLVSRPGQGSSFIMRLPVTLLIIDAIIVEAGGETYAIPEDEVDKVLIVDPARVTTIESGQLYPRNEQSLAAFSLAELVNAADGRTGMRFGLVCRHAGQAVLFLVDQVKGLQEVVVHTVTDPLIMRKGVVGATELGDGRVILILDAGGLL